ETERRLRRIADELDRIGQEHLQPIEDELTQARKLLQSSPSSANPSANVPRFGNGKTDSKSQVPSGSSKAKSEAKSESVAEKSTGRSKKSDKSDPRPEGALRQVAGNQAAVIESLG